MCPSQFQFGYVMDGDWVVVGPAILCIKKTKLRLRSVAKRSEAYLNFFLILELQSLTTTLGYFEVLLATFRYFWVPCGTFGYFKVL